MPGVDKYKLADRIPLSGRRDVQDRKRGELV